MNSEDSQISLSIFIANPFLLEVDSFTESCFLRSHVVIQYSVSTWAFTSGRAIPEQMGTLEAIYRRSIH